MNKPLFISYLLGILLGIFISIGFSFPSFFIENIRTEVIVHSSVYIAPNVLFMFSMCFMIFLFIISAFFINFYTKKTDDSAPLYFSVYCWILIIASVVTIFPFGNWQILLKAVCILNYISILFLHLYLHTYMRQPSNQVSTNVIYIIIGFFIIMTFLASTSQLNVIFKISNIFALIYFFYLCIKSFRLLDKRKKQSIGNFISILLLTVCNIQHLLVHYELIDGESLNALGVFIFLTIHSVLLTNRFLYAYSESIVMKQVLQEKVKERTNELEVANQELRRIEAEKRELISNVCHDLANPITTINLVLKGAVDGEITTLNKQYINLMYNQSQIMRSMLEDLRQLNLLESNQLHFQMQKTNWYDFTESIFKRYQEIVQIEGLTYIYSIETKSNENTTVIVDSLRLEQVYFNLISNSVKFTPADGKIEVKVGVDEKKGFAILTIIDNGVGMTADQLPQVYNRFFRTEPIRPEKESTGLGLSIVRSIISKHQGHIQIESEQGKGTNVTIMIPLFFNEKDDD